MSDEQEKPMPEIAIQGSLNRARYTAAYLSAMAGMAGPFDGGRGNGKPRYSTVTKYDPCPCGSGKKFKFCCFK